MSADEPTKPSTLSFHYIKSTCFRVIHVDGALGGPLPSGRGVHLGLYSERAAIPQQVTHEIDSKGHVGREIPEQRLSRDGVVRELEVDAVMDVETAEAIRDWLSKNIALLKGLSTSP